MFFFKRFCAAAYSVAFQLFIHLATKDLFKNIFVEQALDDTFEFASIIVLSIFQPVCNDSYWEHDLTCEECWFQKVTADCSRLLVLLVLDKTGGSVHCLVIVSFFHLQYTDFLRIPHTKIDFLRIPHTKIDYFRTYV